MSRPINISDSVKLIPNAYTNTGSYNFTSQTINNAYTDADSTSSNRMTLSSNRNNTRKSEIYYEFDKSSLTNIPSNAIIDSVTANVKYYIGSSSGTATTYVTEVSMQLYSNTTAKGTAVTSRPTSTSGTKYAITAGTWTRAELDNIRLYVSGTHSASTTAAYIYFYGADVTINYSLSYTEYEVTSTLATDAVDSIDPAGQTYVMGGEDYELNIYADDISNIVVEDNGVDVTSSLVQHQVSSGGTTSTVLGTYTLVSGSFNGSGATYFQGLVGKGEDATPTTSNYYSGSNGTIAVFTYNLSFDDIPSNATITRVYLRVNGHCENTSQSSEYMCVQLLNGSTAISSELNFKSIGTSNSTQTVEATTLPTVAQLNNLKVQCRLGYYGGAINGATCYVEYTTPVTSPYYWTYTLTNVQADHTVVISNIAGTQKMYLKVNGSWVQASKVYKKVNGSWVEQSNLSNLFDQNTIYIKV